MPRQVIEEILSSWEVNKIKNKTTILKIENEYSVLRFLKILAIIIINFFSIQGLLLCRDTVYKLSKLLIIKLQY